MSVLLWDAEIVVDDMVSSSIFLTHPVSKHTVDLRLVDANGSISALTVDLEATLDGRAVLDADAQWYSIASHPFTGPELTALAAMFHVVDAPTKRVRLKVTTSTGEASGDTLTGRYQEGVV